MNNVKERPMSFTDEMIRAILDGRKTQTRRPIKPEHFRPVWEPGYAFRFDDQRVVINPTEKHTAVINIGDPNIAKQWCPHYRVSDYYSPIQGSLWVRERSLIWTDGAGRLIHAETGPIYQDSPDYIGCLRDAKRGAPWAITPASKMPRWASRLTLEITELRAERLQDISERDAWAEGFHNPEGENRNYPDRARYWFRNLWDSIYGKKHPWESNPWVWVIGFKGRI